MMDLVFNLANSLAFFCWLTIAIFARKKIVLAIVQYGVIGLLALTYVILIIPMMANFKPDAFSSLSSIRALFVEDGFLLAGWVHYLAFDLFVGLYIIKSGEKSGIPRWLYTICLPLTFLFGPVGLLLFYSFKLLRS